MGLHLFCVRLFPSAAGSDAGGAEETVEGLSLLELVGVGRGAPWDFHLAEHAGAQPGGFAGLPGGAHRDENIVFSVPA